METTLASDTGLTGRVRDVRRAPLAVLARPACRERGTDGALVNAPPGAREMLMQCSFNSAI